MNVCVCVEGGRGVTVLTVVAASPVSVCLCMYVCMRECMCVFVCENDFKLFSLSCHVQFYFRMMF